MPDQTTGPVTGGLCWETERHEEVLISSITSVIAKSQFRKIWVKGRKKKGGFLWKERKS